MKPIYGGKDNIEKEIDAEQSMSNNEMVSMPMLVEIKQSDDISSMPMCFEDEQTGGKFMEGIPGVKLWTQLPMSSIILKKAQEACNWSKNGFPGGQPLSMDTQNIRFLKEAPYKVWNL